MKPMFALIAFGIISTGITLAIALNLHDGVVTNSKYEDGLNYELNEKLEQEYKNELIFNGFTIEANKMILDAVIPEDNMPDTVYLRSPIKKNSYQFYNDNSSFIYNSVSDIKQGWYNLELIYIVDNRSVLVVYNYYHEK